MPVRRSPWLLVALLTPLPGIIGCAARTFPPRLSSGCVPSAATATEVVEMFRSPFDGEFRVGNFFDHDSPLAFEDTRPIIRTICGTTVKGQVNGHNGYDFSMPEGTTLRAVAAGTVAYSAPEPPFFCPSLGKTVQALV